MRAFEPFDRVKLSPAGLKFCRHLKNSEQKRGVITRLTDWGCIYVLWNGGKRATGWIAELLELDSQDSPSPQPASTREQRFTKKDI